MPAAIPAANKRSAMQDRSAPTTTRWSKSAYAFLSHFPFSFPVLQRNHDMRFAFACARGFN